jgi:hypothetical protein
MSAQTPRVVFIPGYRENTEAMLNKMKKVRNKPPMKHVSDDRFNYLVQCAESFIEKAKEIEAEASENAGGKNNIRELYVAYCDEARRAIYTSYDEPLARAGFREAERQRIKASKPRTEGITSIIERLARQCESSKPSELWLQFIGELDKGQMEPEERVTDKGSLQVAYRDQHDKLRTLSYERFGKRLREAKNNL